jgi:hypothetical protein
MISLWSVAQDFVAFSCAGFQLRQVAQDFVAVCCAGFLNPSQHTATWKSLATCRNFEILRNYTTEIKIEKEGNFCMHEFCKTLHDLNR